MTEEEKRHQKALLLLECQEAGNNSAALREKVRRKAHPFHVVHQWLRYVSGEAKAHEYGEDLSKSGEMIHSNLAQYKQELDVDSAFALVGEVEAAKVLLDDLRRRKGELGLR